MNRKWMLVFGFFVISLVANNVVSYAEGFSGFYRMIDGTCRNVAKIHHRGDIIYLKGGDGADERYEKVTNERHKFYLNGDTRSSYIVFYPGEDKFVFTAHRRTCTYKKEHD